jgi:hypothetical protein
MSARIRGRGRRGDLAMTPSSSRTLFFSAALHLMLVHKDRFGGGAETDTRGACAPRSAVAAQVNLTR